MPACFSSYTCLDEVQMAPLGWWNWSHVLRSSMTSEVWPFFKQFLVVWAFTSVDVWQHANTRELSPQWARLICVPYLSHCLCLMIMTGACTGPRCQLCCISRRAAHRQHPGKWYAACCNYPCITSKAVYQTCCLCNIKNGQTISYCDRFPFFS